MSDASGPIYEVILLTKIFFIIIKMSNATELQKVCSSTQHRNRALQIISHRPVGVAVQ